MKKIIAFLSMFFMIFIMASIAFCDDATTNTIGTSLSNLLYTVVFPVITAFLIGMVSVILNKIRQKFNIQISASIQENIEKFASQGIAAAEEKASDYVKRNVTKLTGKEKLDLAVAHVISSMPEVSPEQAEKVVHGLLSKMGAGASTSPAIVSE